MNNLRRKAIQGIYDRLDEIRADLECIQEEEQEALDNIPESLQGTERYELSENAVENLNNAVSGLEEILEYLEEAAE